jgi:hypothetical protein
MKDIKTSFIETTDNIPIDLKATLDKNGLKQVWVAEKLGTSPQTINNHIKKMSKAWNFIYTRFLKDKGYEIIYK